MIVNWPSNLLSIITVTEFSSGLLVIESTIPPRIVYFKNPVRLSVVDGVVTVSGGLIWAGGVGVGVGVVSGIEIPGNSPSGLKLPMKAIIATINATANAAPNLSTPAI